MTDAYQVNSDQSSTDQNNNDQSNNDQSSTVTLQLHRKTETSAVLWHVSV